MSDTKTASPVLFNYTKLYEKSVMIYTENLSFVVLKLTFIQRCLPKKFQWTGHILTTGNFFVIAPYLISTPTANSLNIPAHNTFTQVVLNVNQFN